MDHIDIIIMEFWYNYNNMEFIEYGGKYNANVLLKQRIVISDI